MTEPSEKEKAYAALELLAANDRYTDAQRVRLVSDVQYYIYSLELMQEILG